VSLSIEECGPRRGSNHKREGSTSVGDQYNCVPGGSAGKVRRGWCCWEIKLVDTMAKIVPGVLGRGVYNLVGRLEEVSEDFLRGSGGRMAFCQRPATQPGRNQTATRRPTIGAVLHARTEMLRRGRVRLLRKLPSRTKRWRSAAGGVRGEGEPTRPSAQKACAFTTSTTVDSSPVCLCVSSNACPTLIAYVACLCAVCVRKAFFLYLCFCAFLHRAPLVPRPSSFNSTDPSALVVSPRSHQPPDHKARSPSPGPGLIFLQICCCELARSKAASPHGSKVRTNPHWRSSAWDFWATGATPALETGCIRSGHL
jgi:hypothetical protein